MAEIVKDKLPPQTSGVLGKVPTEVTGKPIRKPGGSPGEAAKTTLTGDRYSAKILNEVLEKLKAFVLFRTGKVLSREKGSEELTPFEKAFLERFAEEGTARREMPLLERGQFRFLEKTEKAWVEFFQKFVAFTLTKTAKIGDLEAMIYRGLMKVAGREPKGTLISDLKFTDGKTDKFARLEIGESRILEQMASRLPGDLLAKALVAEWIGGPEFAYQALSHKAVNPDTRSTDKDGVKSEKFREGQASQGIALDARTEQLIAERLELNLRTSPDASLRQTSGRGEISAFPVNGKRRKGLFGGMLESYDSGPVFVPWYQQVLHPRKFPGKVRWYVPLIYFVAVSAAGLFVFSLVKFLLQGR